MITVTVYHNIATDAEGRSLGYFGYEHGHDMRDVFTYTSGLSATDPEMIAEEAFRLFNLGTGFDGVPDTRAAEYRKCGLRSLSVGDVVQIGNAWLACEAGGWRTLTVRPIPTEGELAAERRQAMRARFQTRIAEQAIALGAQWAVC